jgi:hypothetical protein
LRAVVDRVDGVARPIPWWYHLDRGTHALRTSHFALRCSLFAVLAIAGSSFAQTDAGSHADWAERQVPLLEQVDALLKDWAVESPFESSQIGAPVGPSGYAGTELDLANNRILVFWKKGVQVPQGAADRLAQVSAAGFNLAVLPAPWSVLDLRDEYRLLVTNPAFHELGIESIGRLRAGQGFLVSATDPERVLSSAVFKALIARLNARAESPPDQPVQVEPVHDYMLFASRDDDTSPFTAGSRLSIGSSAGSTGFSVGNVLGKYIATAGHNVNHTDNVAVSNGALRPLGLSEKTQRRDVGTLDRLDLALIGRLNCLVGPGSACVGWGTVRPQMWVGDVGFNEHTRIIKNSTAAVPGMVLCTSGSFSGTRCNIMVDALDLRVEFLFEVPVRSLVRGVQLDDESASGQGDSGGPVFTVRGNGNEANAAGLIIGGDRNHRRRS